MIKTTTPASPATTLTELHLMMASFHGCGGMKGLYEKTGTYVTSPNGDAMLIRSHIAYHSGVRSAESIDITPSRGHRYRIMLRAGCRPPPGFGNVIGKRGLLVEVVDRYDHREGVRGWVYPLGEA